ncbi:MAG TPA: prolyl oligopeptidase family serine peptidase [Terracidiphilus sp.]|nr:prolyl oligopeptidase family serine peptidase [Terracidiphilus sp.]
MRRQYFSCVLAAGLIPLCAQIPAAQSQSANTNAITAPPVAPIKDVVDDYYGTKVPDPYRYMENLKDPEVEAWFKGQNAYTRAVLNAVPGRAKLLARIRELDQSVPRVFAARLPGDVFLIWKRLPNEDTGKMYLRNGVNGTDRLLLDPEKIKLSSEDQAKGKNQIGNTSISDDGKLMVVAIMPGGSETNNELHVIEIATGRELPDVVAHGACAEGLCASWLPDNHSFVYGRLQDLPAGAPPEQMRQNFRAYLHVLGTDPEKDKPVFGADVVPSIEVDKSLIASVIIPRGSKYAIGVLNGSVTPNSAYYIAPVETLGKSGTPWRKISDFEDGVTDIAVQEDDLYLLTYKDTPRYKVIRTDARKPELASGQIVVPPGQAVVTGLYRAKDALYVSLMDGGIGRLLRVPYGASTTPESIPLPFDGSIYLSSDSRVSGVAMYAITWTRAGRIYLYDPQSKKVTDTGMQPKGPYDDPGNLESVEVKVPSHDGTMVPLSIVYKKGLKLDGTNSTLMEGYGGYSISITPYFDPTQVAWYELGGVFAVCHARGGGEYGEEWHLAGKGATKPNTWLDFIACAQYLIDQKYTSTPRLAGTGGSAGGILIGRAIEERPGLFGTAIIDVGFLDTVRSEHTANGETNIPEVGTVRTEEGFKNLYQMSAYAHVKDQTPYPAVLLTTGSNDPRVDPWMPGKMAARLQTATSSGRPILLRVDYGGGHGGGSGEAERQEVTADRWSFLLWQFGVPGFQPQR